MTEPEGYLATGFRDVDRNSDLDKLAACLRFMEGLPSFIAYKKRSYEMMRLRSGQVVADLGCGLGFDVQKISARVAPGGRVIGIDSSLLLLQAARQAFGGLEGVEFAPGDIHNLDFAANACDALRVDRTLQHVAEPEKVTAEMHRVLKPGGWLVCAEPDWATFVIDCDDPATSELVGDRWKRSFRNPHIGRGLLRMLRQEGLGNTSAEGFILLAEGLEAVNVVYDIYKTVEMMKEDWKGEEGRLTAWLDRLRELEGGAGVSASVTLFLACGQKAG